MTGTIDTKEMTLWQLITARADLTPDKQMARDHCRAHPRLRRVPRLVRADGCRLRRLGRRRRQRCLVGAAVALRVARGRRSACATRRHPEPDPADLPPPRGRVHHEAEQVRCCSSLRACSAASTTRRWPTKSTCPATLVVDDRARPKATRRRSPPTVPHSRSCAGSSTRRARQPTRKARSTATARCRQQTTACSGAWRSATTTRRPSSSRSRTSVVSSGCSTRCRPASSC